MEVLEADWLAAAEYVKLAVLEHLPELAWLEDRKPKFMVKMGCSGGGGGEKQRMRRMRNM